MLNKGLLRLQQRSEDNKWSLIMTIDSIKMKYLCWHY
jgi:hypothetical protein